MKVLVLDVNGRGGHAHHIFFMCNALADLGVNVVVITTKAHELDLSKARFAYKQVLTPHYEKKSSLMKGLFYLFSWIKFCFYVFREKPTIIHLHDFKIPFLEYYLIKLFHWQKIKVVCSAHNVTHHEKQAATHYLKLLYNSYDRIIAHAKDNKQKLVAAFNVDAEKIHVIPVGEYSFLAGELKDKTAARKLLGISANRKVVLFFGYIRKYKGIGVLLESVAIARQSIPEIFLIIAGEPKEDFSIYEQTINKLNLADIILSEIKYIPVEDISTYFSASDVVALPYLNIYQSGILYLAYAYQRPVIATNVGGLPEVVEENKSGFIVPPNDPTEFARAIEKSFSDLNKLERMGRYAYQKAKQDYSWEGIAEKMVVVYKNIIR